MFLIDLFRPDLKIHTPADSARPLLSAVASELFEEILKMEKDLRIRVTGTSMIPFIRNGEYVTIKRVKPSRLNSGDIVFFRGLDNECILHRIMLKGNNENGTPVFQTKGDAMMAFDAPVSEDRILGRVFRIEKKDIHGIAKITDLQSGKWRIINHLLALIHRLRSLLYFKIYVPLKK
jgi:signal peptidase I